MRVVVIFGPTASGKTEALLNIFEGQNAEVVSADSRQVYVGMDIGTAKPSPEIRQRLPHHLINILEPSVSFSVGDFVHHADLAVRDIVARGKVPVLSGGTGFYLKNFIMGLPLTPPSDAGIREALKAELAEQGVEHLVGELAACDPISAEHIHPNNTVRLLRALEVWRLTGKPLSSFALPEKPRTGYEFLLIGLDRPRGELYTRIDARCAKMFADGLPQEVSALVKRYGPQAPGLQAIGYSEFLRNGVFCEDFASVQSVVAQDSRHYAKRQLTYFASLPDVVWVNADDTAALRRLVRT